MSRNNGYKNEFDPEDDGKDIEFTEQDYARSYDQGREEAVVLLRAGNAIKGGGRLDHDHRRMFYRWAKRELADGRLRREAAAAAEKATLAAEQKAEKERVAQADRTRQNRELLDKSGRESAAMWASVEAANKEAEAEWAAGREAREAVAARPVQVTAPPMPERRDAPRSPTTITTSNTASARPATKRVTTATLPVAAGPIGTATPGPARPAGSPSASRSAHAASRPRETQPSGGTPHQPSPPRNPPQPQRVEPERRVATSARPLTSPPNPASSPATTRPTPPGATPPVTRTPTATAVHEPRAIASPSTPLLTGADLAAWRSARGLTQRPAANLLGVAPSTVAKAELLPGKVLGEQLRVALAAALKR